MKIVLIGAGNVASHLGMALKDAGNEILQVYSQTEKSAGNLARKLKINYTICLPELDRTADLYIIAVSDDVVPLILDQLNLEKRLIVHTSGFLPMHILKKTSENLGVLYPLQTFSMLKGVKMKSVPLCIEASSEENLSKLRLLAVEISDDVKEINSEQRKKIHLAAVFACNFPNFMYIIAEKLLEDSNINFDILKPLIRETTEKVQAINPSEAQTGPAVRGDEKVIADHLELLNKYPAYKQLYQLISKEIKENKQ